MIVPAKLYGDGIMDGYHRYKLELTFFVLGDPLVMRYGSDLIWTSGHRTEAKQKSLALDPRTASKVAKTGNPSQHLLGEAIDCDGPSNVLLDAFKWAFANLRWWQIILYFKDGQADSMHLSLMSEVRTIQRKALYYINGEPYLYGGDFSQGGLTA
jgi:hypothetical protein